MRFQQLEPNGEPIHRAAPRTRIFAKLDWVVTPAPLGLRRHRRTAAIHCLGCCWALMALLFLGGVMNLYWTAGLALFVLLEKTIPPGHRLASLSGLGLVAWGVALLAAVA
jgi:predicted metal-binding membrane protein